MRENTDLERRVLAHEQILQALMAQLAEGQPDFLTRMTRRFAARYRAAHQHDCVETADYAEAFLNEVVRIRDRGHAPDLGHSEAAVAPHSPWQPLSNNDPMVVISVRRSGGVWHVSQDGSFYGDYLAEAPAREAAYRLASDIAGRGEQVSVLFEGG